MSPPAHHHSSRPRHRHRTPKTWILVTFRVGNTNLWSKLDFGPINFPRVFLVCWRDVTMCTGWSCLLTWVTVSPRADLWKQIAAQIRIPQVRDRVGAWAGSTWGLVVVVGGWPELGVVMGEAMGGPRPLTWVTVSPPRRIWKQIAAQIRIPHI